MQHTMATLLKDTNGMSPGKSRAVKFLMLYVVWLLVGTFWYAYAPNSNLGLVMGFYMAINIGYSIGFGWPTEPFRNYLWFSSFYVIVGASFVALALSFFADKISEDHDNWFTNMMQNQAYEDAFKKGTSFSTKAKAVFVQYAAPIRAISVWLVWIFIMTLYAAVRVPEWTVAEAQYFAVSTCSTGGHYPLPADSPTWLFGLTAVMMMMGVPFMAVGMASAAQLFMDQGDLEGTKATICEEVDIDELLMLQKFGLENGDGVIDHAEFIILCMVRMGTDPNLIEFISDRFVELDEDGGGSLSILEITKGKYDCIDGVITPVSEIPDGKRDVEVGKDAAAEHALSNSHSPPSHDPNAAAHRTTSNITPSPPPRPGSGLHNPNTMVMSQEQSTSTPPVVNGTGNRNAPPAHHPLPNHETVEGNTTTPLRQLGVARHN